MGFFTIITFILTTHSLTLCTQCPYKNSKSPKIAFVLPTRESDGNGDIDFKNETTLIVSNSYAKVDFICTASYPIEWIVHYDKDDDGGAIRTAYVYRNVTNFFDPSTYEYKAVVKFYSAKVCSSANFSCESTLESNKTCWSSAVVTEIPKNDELKRNILVFTIKENFYLGRLQEFSNQTCIGKAFFYNLTVEGERRPCWECYRNANKENTQLTLVTEDFHTCYSAMLCKNYFGIANQGTHCLTVKHHDFATEDEADDFYDTSNCKSNSIGKQSAGGRFIACKNFGLILAQHFIVSMRDKKKGRETYFHLSDINPERMFSIKVDKSYVYLGDEFSAQCTFALYYFSYGCQIAVEMSNGTLHLLTDQKSEVPEQIEPTFTIRSKVKAFDSNIRRVVCLGAVWNSTEWVKKSAEITLDLYPEEASVKEISDDAEVNFYVGETNKSIRCNGLGRPTPKLRWTVTPLTNPSTHYNETGGYSEIHFQEISHSHAGVYICQAENFLGNYTQTYRLVVADEGNRTVIIITSVLGTMLCIVSLFVYLFWRKAKLQSEIIRSLTDSEVKEFMEGNNQNRKGNDYLNAPDNIGSLPYSQKFEISRQRLKFEESQVLGKGAYGQVYMGLLKNTENSENFDEVVALKTVDNTVSVEYFKALLSEVKIMAYIGQHKNIASLVGACTENIKFREVFIAIELCTKGDLKEFLCKTRSNFQDLVNSNNDNQTNKENVAVDPDTSMSYSLSTIDLMKWTADIAEGMEFLAEKKVIHGDLAARNVLLTEDLIAKVSDFGLSRQLVEFSNYVKTTKMPLPFRWMALESLKYLEFSPQSDIWAFGVTMWEIFTLGEVPFAGCNYSVDFIEQLSGGMRLGKPKSCPDDVYMFILKTWDNNPTERPPYSEIKTLCKNYCISLKPVADYAIMDI